MSSLNQRTVRQKVSCRGVGLHSGAPVELTFLPAQPDTGITFVRTDIDHPTEIPARADHVVDTSLATTLGVNGTRIATVEHVLAALTGLGIDNVRIQVDGPEVPIMDGSAAPFAELIDQAGVEVQRRTRRYLVIRRSVSVSDGDKTARLSPANRPAVSCTVDFDHPLISNQHLSIELTDRTFLRELARARTFGFLKDVEALKAAGLARGGSLANAIVIDDFSILNPDGLRYPDEFVRHKVLDAIGDLGLFGMPVIGHFEAVKTGHTLNQRLVRRVLADATAYEVISAGAVDFARLDLPLPALTPATA